ncbi:MAG: type III pantothenate kinase [Verrucomicrobia bacterium]|nr:type III pantothenate kinase [Verrucomicrobiota bacterium]
MQLVVDCGSQEIKAGLFAEDRLVHSLNGKRPEQLLELLKDKKIERGLIASSDSTSQEMAALLSTQGFPCRILEAKDFGKLATSETLPLLQPARIANIYGALSHFPSNDCVIVDLGTSIRFDYVTKQGVYQGGAVFPHFEAIFRELEKTDFPGFGESIDSLGKDKLSQAKSGCYFGILGAIERIVAELRLSSDAPSNVMSIATGGATRFPAIQKDLQDFIDIVDPQLTLIGLNQILKEVNK